jgi:hypothetical protein
VCHGKNKALRFIKERINDMQGYNVYCNGEKVDRITLER